MTKETKIWWPRYVGDYQRKTQHLSLAEHGAYALLLDHYYMGGELKTNDTFLFRICRAFDIEEQAAVKNVVNQFFTIKDGCYINERASEELQTRTNISEKRKNARSGKTTKQEQNNNKTTTKNNQVVTQSQSHITIDKSIVNTPAHFENEFNEFWGLYPKRVAKPQALKAYKKILTNGVTHETVIAGLNRYKKHIGICATPPQFIKHPASWLNAAGWLDEHQTEGLGNNPRGQAFNPQRSAATVAMEATFAEMQDLHMGS